MKKRELFSRSKSGVCKVISRPRNNRRRKNGCMMTTPKSPAAQHSFDLKRDRFLKPYLELIAAAGAGAVMFSIAHVRWLELGLPFLLLVVVTVSLGSRIVVRFFRFDSCISISDIFVFLALLMFDGEAAVLLASLEGFFSSLRI